MTFEIEVDGRVRVVSVDAVGAASSTGGIFRLTMRDDVRSGQRPGRVFEVDARRTDLGLSLRDPRDGRMVDVAVTERQGGVLVQLPHVDVAVVVDGRRSRRAGAEASGTGLQRVTAPMPGRVVRVLVAVGDEVAAGQAVVVIEAMKMENDLRVLRAGRVREVFAVEASSVDAGRLLVVVE